MLRTAGAFLIALVAASVLAAIVQTQYNLAQLSELAVAIDWETRKHTILHDLQYFTPTIAIILGATLIVALPIAYAFYRRSQQRWWFPLAGFVGLAVAFSIIDSLLPMPTLLAVNREWDGLLWMCLTGAMAGQLFVSIGVVEPQGEGQS